MTLRRQASHHSPCHICFPTSTPATLLTRPSREVLPLQPARAPAVPPCQINAVLVYKSVKDSSSSLQQPASPGGAASLSSLMISSDLVVDVESHVAFQAGFEVASPAPCEVRERARARHSLIACVPLVGHISSAKSSASTRVFSHPHAALPIPMTRAGAPEAGQRGGSGVQLLHG